MMVAMVAVTEVVAEVVVTGVRIIQMVDVVTVEVIINWLEVTEFRSWSHPCQTRTRRGPRDQNIPDLVLRPL